MFVNDCLPASPKNPFAKVPKIKNTAVTMVPPTAPQLTLTSSVGSIGRIQDVAEKIAAARSEGHDVVVVVSAMSGETNRLLGLAHEISKQPNSREMDVLLSTGEQVTIALLSMALEEQNCQARSFTGAQVHIRTDSSHNKARIIDIDSARVKKALKAGKVVVIAGFQGIDEYGNITTLGRGGSDLSLIHI